MTQDLLYKLNMLHQLIAARNTGTPLELARKLRISRSCVHKYIGVLKAQGAPIVFCRKCSSYYYTVRGDFSFRFSKIEEDEKV